MVVSILSYDLILDDFGGSPILGHLHNLSTELGFRLKNQPHEILWSYNPPPRHELGVVKEMRIATWMFPERGSEQERGAVDISCFKAKHMAFSENKVVPKTHCLSYCLFILYIYV